MGIARSILLLSACLVAACPAALPPLELHSGDVVAFVGGTDMVRMQKQGRLEAALAWKFRDVAPKFRDLSWDGDTVYYQGTVRERWRREALGDWPAQLERVGATVVIAQFGKIESLDGIERIGEFVEAYAGLLDRFAAGGRRVVLFEPSPLEWEGLGEGAFDSYTTAVRRLADQRGIRSVPCSPADPGGSLLRGLGLGDPPSAFIAAVREKHRLWYDYWRPANWKCLFGDDGKRIFSTAAQGLPSFRDEWSTFPELIAAAEVKLFAGDPLLPEPAPAATGSAEANIEVELAAFDVLAGYEINLFADERHGIANPLSVRWDPDGRMFVACSDVYPQIEPGVMPDDKIVALLDTDADGCADESSVFARGLNIPTGMEVGADGIYVGQNTELLLLGWDGGRRLLLSGFGNGDSHQTINSFAWGLSGSLWFCQGDGIESRVETPYGVASLFQAGVFRLAPRELQLDGLLDDFMGPGNPWGVAFDDFGQSFVIDGAGGVSFLTPASIPAKRRLILPRIGDPGGYCGIDQLAGSVFGIGDYKKNQVSRFAAVADGAGFKIEWLEPLLRSRHRNFRPIDIKVGPDGAIYIVDWYNPITCHQDDFYRHPDRDKTHGRIWRVARVGQLPRAAPQLASAEIPELLGALQSPLQWQRTKAKQVLASRDRESVASAVNRWAAGRDEARDLVEALATLEWIGAKNVGLLERVLASDDYRARAYAARVAGSWRQLGLLGIAAEDDHPRVRLEAVLACGQVPDAGSVMIAAAVAERPRDRWIDYAFSQAVHQLKPHWVPAFLRGELDFSGHSKGLAVVLGSADSKALLAEVRKRLVAGEADGEEQQVLVQALVAVGEEADLIAALDALAPSAALLEALAGRERPGADVVTPLKRALGDERGEVKVAAMDLIARWGVDDLGSEALELASRLGTDGALRAASVRALGSIGGSQARGLLRAMAEKDGERLRVEALEALTDVDLAAAAVIAARLLESDPDMASDGRVFRAFGGREGGIELLADELGKLEVGAESGATLRSAWIRTGLLNGVLSNQLDMAAGLATGAVTYDENLVRELVAAGREGDRSRGEALFNSAKTGCAACHKIGGTGGTIGPDLSAVGSGVPAERIVAEVVWPARQVKDGYSLTRVTMADRSVFLGYLQANRDEEAVLLREISSGETRELPLGKIAKREAVGSLMPATAQSLRRAELADLLAFLFGLGG